MSTTDIKKTDSANMTTTGEAVAVGDNVPSGFILKLYQMVNGAPDEVIRVSCVLRCGRSKIFSQKCVVCVLCSSMKVQNGQRVQHIRDWDT